MQQSNADLLAGRMQSVKDLYAELFLLLLQSVEEDPSAPGAGRLDNSIDSLMHTIDGSMTEFIGGVREARGQRSIPEVLDGEILQFESQLKDGLTTMHERMQRRMAEMARERDELKGQIQMIQRKRTGSRGYRKGIHSAVIYDPLQASA